MIEQTIQYKLAAILIADIEGYSRLMHEDENATITAWQTARSDVIKPIIKDFSGRIVKHTGDGFLAEFQTVTDSVSCAIAMQKKMVESESILKFRMGINFGEIAVDEDDIHGDGVNIAARLESLSLAPGICVTSQVYDQVRRKVSCAFEDMGIHQVKNIDDPIHVYRILCGTPGQVTNAQPAKPQIEKPQAKEAAINSIAILPLQNMSSDPEQDFFADGLTEDLLTELSRFSSLFVISRNSSFTYKGKNIKIMEVARELNVRYVVEGSVRKAGNRIRVTVQLIDGTNDRHIWAEKYDRNIEDIFKIQDEITSAIVATLPGRVEADHIEMARRKTTDNLAAYECLLNGKVLHHNSNFEDNKKSYQLLSRAIELDPEFGHAWAWRACVMGQSWAYGWYDCSEEEHLKSIAEDVEQALALDPNDADTHRLVAALQISRNELDAAAFHLNIALKLNPNYDLIVVQQGELLAWMGNGEEAVRWIKKAMQLNPFHPNRFWSHLARAYFVAREYRESIVAYRNVDALNSVQLGYLSACHAYLDENEEAQKYVDEALSLDKSLTAELHVQKQHFVDDINKSHLQKGLELAGFK